MSEKISLSEEQIGTLCYLLGNFCMSLYFLLLKAYKEEKSSDSPSWIEQYEDILGRPPTEWSHEQKQEMGQLEEGIGKDKAQGVLEETINFLIFFMMIHCGPYILEGEVKKLLDRFYKVTSTEWMPISLLRDRHIKYAKARNPLEKFSIDLAIILDENFITGAKMAIPASSVARDIKSVIDKFFKEPHQFGLNQRAN